MLNGYTLDLTTVLLFIAVLLLIWVALRFLLKLAAKIFACGCVVILLIAAGLFLLTYFGEQWIP